MRRTKTNSRQIDDIKVLLEKLESLQIMNKALDKITEQSDKVISTAPVPVIINNTQTTILKSMVLDPEWFDEDWQRGI